MSCVHVQEVDEIRAGAGVEVYIYQYLTRIVEYGEIPGSDSNLKGKYK